MNTLSVVSTNRFMGLADGNILGWCPALNLLTVSMNKTSIWVYRLNGERIYSLNNKSQITSISFMDSGAFFCLAGLDGLIKVYDSNNGALLKVLTKNFDKIKLIKFNHHNYVSTLKSKFHGIFQIDTLSKLPKLSVDNTTDDLAVATAALDLPRNNDINELNNSDSLNFLIIVDDSNNVAINFNNLLTIDGIALPIRDSHYIDYFDNNNNLFNQMFLVKGSERYELMRMKFNIQSQNYEYLTDIILKFCKITAILNYVSDQLALLKLEVVPFFALYDRHMSNLAEALSGDSNYSQEQLCACFYDLILTNLIPEKLKDFWLNQFGERSYKKLLRSGNSAYDTIRNLIFTKVISSVERLLIILSDLRGLCLWFTDSDNELNFLSLAGLDNIISISKGFLKSLYTLIWDANQEQKLFVQFLNWIKFEIIDKLSKEDDINSYLTGPQQSFKHSDLFKYVNCFIKSKVLRYFELDLSENTIFIQNDKPEIDLCSISGDLNTLFSEKFLTPFKQFTKNSLEFEILDVQLGLFNDIKFKYLQENACVIISWNHGVLSLFKLKLDTPNEKLINLKIQFPSGIEIIYEFKDSHELIVLMKSNDKFQLESFNFLNLFGDHDTLLEYDGVHKTGVLTQDEINLKDPKYMTVNTRPNYESHIVAKSSGADRKSFGCLLDANRQNYVIFSL